MKTTSALVAMTFFLFSLLTVPSVQAGPLEEHCPQSAQSDHWPIDLDDIGGQACPVADQCIETNGENCPVVEMVVGWVEGIRGAVERCVFEGVPEACEEAAGCLATTWWPCDPEPVIVTPIIPTVCQIDCQSRTLFEQTEGQVHGTVYIVTCVVPIGGGISYPFVMVNTEPECPQGEKQGPAQDYNVAQPTDDFEPIATVTAGTCETGTVVSVYGTPVVQGLLVPCAFIS